ncbi:MAG TPA: zinc ribbon domain-containing protein [Gaiellaceae bacterium]|nr:zinc ribbon domain-containing protein [Gaiellaceae bacterium]
MTDGRDAERAAAIAAADTTCPRCGARRAPDQAYCLDCGLALPAVTGRIASLRRGWLRRFGWYPGDWIWGALLTLAVALACAAVSIAVSHRSASHGTSFTAPPPVTTTAPAAPTTTAPAGTTPTTTAPPPAPSPANGHLGWPADENGWTIVLVSYPKSGGRAAAVRTAETAASRRLQQVGVLDSSLYASLQPGYYVVFTGIYDTKADADADVATARQAGFAGAYSRQVSR